MSFDPISSSFADPLRQPQRFMQQTDALVRQSFQQHDVDPAQQLESHLQASFARALEAEMAPPKPAAPAASTASAANAAHHAAPLPLSGGLPAGFPGTMPAAQVSGAAAQMQLAAGQMPIMAMGGDAGVAPYQGVFGASGPVGGFGSYYPPNVSGIPSASLPLAPTIGSAPSAASVAAMQSHPMGPELEGLIHEMAGKYAVPDWLVRNVIRQESGGNPNATSPVGAEGLMQLMPGTAAGLGVHNAYDPRENVEGGVKYLKQLLDHFHGDQTKAVAAYNAGPGAVEKYGGVPPFAETQNYVKRILG